MTHPEQNWAECYTYKAAHIQSPRTIDEVQQIVRTSAKVKALGTRHSFNDIPDTPGDLISLRHLNQAISLDHDKQTVTIEAGMRYGELGRYLETEKFALPNLASLPHISVVVACATATHGSGDRNGNLATAVSAIEYIVADGSSVRFSRSDHPDVFDGVVVSLGALGIAKSITLDLVPSFAVRQDVYEGIPFETAITHFDEIMSGAYSTSMFTDWASPKINQTWRKRLTSTDDITEADPTFFGGSLAKRDLNPIKNASPKNCTTQTGIPGRWNERLNHFRMEFTPSVGEELQSEYLVPRRDAVEAILAVQTIADQIAPHVHLTEIRSIAADRMWLSTAYERDSIAIHFTWKKEWEAVHALMPQIEVLLAPYSPRPHWGKLFTVPAAHLHPRYPQLRAFRRLASSVDPDGKFRNDFLDRYIFSNED